MRTILTPISTKNRQYIDFCTDKTSKFDACKNVNIHTELLLNAENSSSRLTRTENVHNKICSLYISDLEESDGTMSPAKMILVTVSYHKQILRNIT